MAPILCTEATVVDRTLGIAFDIPLTGANGSEMKISIAAMSHDQTRRRPIAVDRIDPFGIVREPPTEYIISGVDKWPIHGSADLSFSTFSGIEIEAGVYLAKAKPARR